MVSPLQVGVCGGGVAMSDDDSRASTSSSSSSSSNQQTEKETSTPKKKESKVSMSKNSKLLSTSAKRWGCSQFSYWFAASSLLPHFILICSLLLLSYSWSSSLALTLNLSTQSYHCLTFFSISVQCLPNFSALCSLFLLHPLFHPEYFPAFFSSGLLLCPQVFLLSFPFSLLASVIGNV